MPRPFHKTNRFLYLDTTMEHHSRVIGHPASVPTVVTIIIIVSIGFPGYMCQTHIDIHLVFSLRKLVS